MHYVRGRGTPPTGRWVPWPGSEDDEHQRTAPLESGTGIQGTGHSFHGAGKPTVPALGTEEVPT